MTTPAMKNRQAGIYLGSTKGPQLTEFMTHRCGYEQPSPRPRLVNQKSTRYTKTTTSLDESRNYIYSFSQQREIVTFKLVVISSGLSLCVQ